MCPVKTQISLGINVTLKQSLHCPPAWRSLGSLSTHWTHSEVSWLIRLADIQADLSHRWHTGHLLVLMCAGSNNSELTVPCLTICKPAVSASRLVFYQWLGRYSDKYCLVDWPRILAEGLIQSFPAHWNKMSRLMTKPTKWHVHPAKTQIILGICQVWSES